MRNFYILCHGGFGNRFNALVGGLYLATRLNCTPIILWPKNNWCDAAFSDLFENTFACEDFRREDFLNRPDMVKVMHDDPIQLGQFININALPSLQHLIDADIKQDIFYFNNLIPGHLIDDATLFMQVLNSLIFKHQIRAEVNRIIEAHTTGPYYGIHIRKTDFGSRSDGAEQYSLQMVNDHPNTTFFICSDDPTTEEKFLRHPNVFAYKKQDYVTPYVNGGWNDTITCRENFSWSFNVNRSAASVVASIVDLLLLSRATAIVSPNIGSTFAQVAAMIAQSTINI